MNKKYQKSKPTREEVNNYFNYSADTGGLSSFTNNDIVCRDCKHRLDSVIKCKKYDEKPGKVIYDGPCKGYTQE